MSRYLPPAHVSHQPGNNLPAAAYLRVARTNNEQSIQRQRKSIQHYAFLHGFKIVEEYIDRGVSGLNYNRIQLQRLFCDARAGLFQVVIAEDASRYSRQTSNFEPFKALLDGGIQIHSTNGNLTFLTLRGLCHSDDLRAQFARRQMAWKTRLTAGQRPKTARGFKDNGDRPHDGKRD
jgi:DNA invertase Pin-like site-specific DNA recombinase